MPDLKETPPSFMEWQELDSLVGSLHTRSLVARPKTVEQCREALDYCRRNGMSVCVRGAGRTYGDLALNDGHALLDVMLAPPTTGDLIAMLAAVACPAMKGAARPSTPSPRSMRSAVSLEATTPATSLRSLR